MLPIRTEYATSTKEVQATGLNENGTADTIDVISDTPGANLSEVAPVETYQMVSTESQQTPTIHIEINGDINIEYPDINFESDSTC